jgi:hypothetical protein
MSESQLVTPESPFSVTSVIEIIGQDENKIRFRIIEGPFAGIDYTVYFDEQKDSEAQEESFNVSYQVDDPEKTNKIFVSILNNIIEADFNQRMKDLLEKEMDV